MGFKKLFLENTEQKPKPDMSVCDDILEIARELYSQNQFQSAEDLYMVASEIYAKRILEEVKKKIQDGLVYTTDLIKQKYPQKELDNFINNRKEELSNDKEN